MARLPEDFIYRLKQANPIDEVMRSYVKLTRAGSLLKCCCPFHSEKTPSCVVYANVQDPHFYCFGCHVGGDVITFIREIENLGYMDAIRMLADRAGLTIPETDENHAESDLRNRVLELNRAAARFYYQALTGSDKRGLIYLANRALKPETIKKYGLGFAGDSFYALTNAMRKQGFTEEELLAANLCGRSNKTGKLYDRFRNRVMFPIFDLRGSVIAFGGRTIEPGGEPKYLNSSDTVAFKKGRNLFSMNFAKKSHSKRLILAEGYMDVIAINQGGFENVVASLGTALTPDQCRLMRQYAEEVIISYDSDAAGQNATLKAINLLRDVGLRPRILHIEGAKDPDEYIKKYGSDHFRHLLDNAEDALTFELNRCKTDVNLNEGDGTVTALHRAVSVLAGIENDLDRSVYLSRTAKEYDVSVNLLEAQVEQEIRKRRKQEKVQNRTALMRSPDVKDPVNPDANGNQAGAKAEEMILCYLMRNPDSLEKIEAQIAPEDFVTSLNRRIYTYYLAHVKAGEMPSISMFDSEEFTPQEIGHIAGIEAKHHDLTVTEQSVADCIRLLKNRMPSAQEAAELDTAAWAQSMRDARRRKSK